MNCGIYLLTNKVNGKQYVGQSINIKKRMREHANANKKDCAYLHNAIRKHGWESFDLKMLIVVDSKEDMNRYERALIEQYGTLSPGGYNCKDGGLSGRVSEATRRKQSVAKLGKPQNLTPEQRSARAAIWLGRSHSEETKQRMREWNLGRKMPADSKLFTDEYRQKMSELKRGQVPFMAGKTHTSEAKAKMSAAHKGKPKSPEHLAAIAAAKARKKLATQQTDGGQL